MKKIEEAVNTYYDYMTEKLDLKVAKSLLLAVAEGLGEGVIFHPDASLVACSDKAERERVKKDFLTGTLKLTDSAAMDKAIESVCAQMGSSNRKKYRVVFYYLLLEKLDKKDYFNTKTIHSIPTSSISAAAVTPVAEHAALPVETKAKKSGPVPGSTTVDPIKEQAAVPEKEMDGDSYISTFETVSPGADHHFENPEPIGNVAVGEEIPRIERPLMGKDAQSVLKEIEVSAPQQTPVAEKSPGSHKEPKKMETIDQSLEIYGEHLRDELSVFDVHHDLLRGLAESLGTGVLKGDGALISCDSPEERARIKHNFLQNRLQLADGPELDAAIEEVCKKMGESGKPAYRVIFYYLLTRRLNSEHAILTREHACLF